MIGRSRGSGSRKREFDPYLEKVKKEGREREVKGDGGSSEEDSDFAPGEEDDVAEEYDSHAEYVTSSEEGEPGAGGEGGAASSSGDKEKKKKKERRIASTIVSIKYATECVVISDQC